MDKGAGDLPAAAAPEPRRMWRPYQVYAVAVLVLCSVSNYLDRNIVSLLQEPIKADLRLSDWQLGLISGPAFALFHALAGLPVARIAERVSRPRLLAAVVTLWSAMTALCGMATNFVQLAIFRAGVGLGEGGCNPISHSLVADTFTVRQRGLAMSILSLGSPLGGIIAPLVGGIVAHYWGWRTAFVVVGVPGLLLALAALTLREPRSARPAADLKRSTFRSDMGWLIRNRAFVFVFLAGAFNGVGIQGLGIFTSSYLIRVQGLELAQAAGVVSLVGVMGVIGTFIGGYCADRFADARGRSYVLVPAVGAVLSFLLFSVAFASPYWAVTAAALLLGNIATDLKNGPNFAAVQNIVPSHMRATAAALFFLAASVIGTGVGATLVGGLSDLAAARAFGSDMAAYLSACPGGRAAVAGAAEACRTASATGLATAMRVIPFMFVGAAACFYMASRTIRVNTD